MIIGILVLWVISFHITFSTVLLRSSFAAMFLLKRPFFLVSPESVLVKNLKPLVASSGLQIQSYSTAATGAPSSPSMQNSPSSKDDILIDYSNRNPRNMELLRLARQPQGYDLDCKHLYYWNRLELHESGRFISGSVRQASGKVVVRASTSEWPLQCRLPSARGYSAVVALARVLARRCLEAGYTEMAVDPALAVETSAKTKAFVETMQESGVRLTEDFQLHETDMYPWALERPTLPWQVPEHVALPDDAAAPA